MISAEKKTCKIKTASWSPAYSKAVEDKAFWKIALSLRHTYTKPNAKFLAWSQSQHIDDFPSIDTKTIISKLRAAHIEKSKRKQTNYEIHIYGSC
jgi:hypothetical protein